MEEQPDFDTVNENLSKLKGEDRLYISLREYRQNEKKLPDKEKVINLANAFVGESNVMTRPPSGDYVGDADREDIDKVVTIQKHGGWNDDIQNLFDRQVVNELPSINPLNSGKGDKYSVPTADFD